MGIPRDSKSSHQQLSECSEKHALIRSPKFLSVSKHVDEDGFGLFPRDRRPEVQEADLEKP